MGVFKHAKQTFGGLGLLLVDVHHLTIRAHDPLLVVLDVLKLLMHLVISVVRSGRGGIQFFDADAKSIGRIGGVLERAYRLLNTAKTLLDGVAIRELPTVILVGPILRNGLHGFGNSRGSVLRTALNVLERVCDSPVHRLRVRDGIIVRADRTARQTQCRGRAADGDADRPAKEIDHAAQSGLQQTSLTDGTLSRLADTTNQTSRTSASGNACDGGTASLRTIHAIQLRSGLVGSDTHPANFGNLTGQHASRLTGLQTSHGPNQLAHTDRSLLRGDTQLAQSLPILQRGLDVLQHATLQRIVSADASLSERRIHADHRLNGRRQLAERLSHGGSAIGQHLDRRSRRLQRVPQRSTERVGQFAAHRQQTVEHRSCGINGTEHLLESLGHAVAEIRDAMLRLAGKTADGANAGGHHGACVNERLLRRVPQLISRVANLTERIMELARSGLRPVGPRGQRGLELHAVHGPVSTAQSVGELLDAILALGQRAERALEDTASRLDARHEIATLLDGLLHGPSNLAGTLRLIDPLRHQRGVTAHIVGHARQIRAGAVAKPHNGSGDSLNARVKRVHALDRIAENRTDTTHIRFLRDDTRRIGDDAPFRVGHAVHVLDGLAVPERVHHVDDRLLRLGPERVRQLLLQATQLRSGHVDIIRVVLRGGISDAESSGHTQQCARSGQSRLAHHHQGSAGTASGTGQVQRSGADGREHRAQQTPLRHDLIEFVEHVHELLPLVLHATDTRGSSGHAAHDLAEIGALELREDINRARSREVSEMGAGGGGLQIHVHIERVIGLPEILDTLLGTLHVQVEIGLKLDLAIRVASHLFRDLPGTLNQVLIVDDDIRGNPDAPMLELTQTLLKRVSRIGPEVNADPELVLAFELLRQLAYLTCDVRVLAVEPAIIQHESRLDRIGLDLLAEPVDGGELVVQLPVDFRIPAVLVHAVQGPLQAGQPLLLLVKQPVRFLHAPAVRVHHVGGGLQVPRIPCRAFQQVSLPFGAVTPRIVQTLLLPARGTFRIELTVQILAEEADPGKNVRLAHVGGSGETATGHAGERVAHGLRMRIQFDKLLVQIVNPLRHTIGLQPVLLSGKPVRLVRDLAHVACGRTVFGAKLAKPDGLRLRLIAASTATKRITVRGNPGNLGTQLVVTLPQSIQRAHVAENLPVQLIPLVATHRNKLVTVGANPAHPLFGPVKKKHLLLQTARLRLPEHAKIPGEHVADVLLDLTQLFDTVDRHIQTLDDTTAVENRSDGLLVPFAQQFILLRQCTQTGHVNVIRDIDAGVTPIPLLIRARSGHVIRVELNRDLQITKIMQLRPKFRKKPVGKRNDINADLASGKSRTPHTHTLLKETPMNPRGRKEGKDPSETWAKTETGKISRRNNYGPGPYNQPDSSPVKHPHA